MSDVDLEYVDWDDILKGGATLFHGLLDEELKRIVRINNVSKIEMNKFLIRNKERILEARNEKADDHFKYAGFDYRSAI